MVSKIQVKTLRAVGLSLCICILTGFYHLSHSSVPDKGGYAIKTVVIDAGHGGKDPGCHGLNSREKDIVLAISLALGRKMKATFPGIQVIYTRDKDVFIPLHERAKIANRNKADLFISIHCNYIEKRNKAFGTETYVMGLHRAKDNLEVAKRENAAILHEEDYEEHYDGYDPDSPEGHIILSMFQNAHLVQSILLAQYIEDEFINRLKRHSRGVKQAGFLVLRNTTMPSVLVETGFLSHDEEEEFLRDKKNQEAVADALLNAFKLYKSEIESPGLEVSITGSESEMATAQSHSTEHNLCFKVQLAASKTKYDIREGIWKNAGAVETKQEQDFYKYLVGPYYKLEDAMTAKDRLRKNGFEGAFVVAYRGEDRIPVQDAQTALLDKE